jgi:hypothetical protein
MEVGEDHSLPGDLGWRRALDGASQQDRGVFPDSMGAQRNPEPGAPARTQLPQLLGLPDLLLRLQVGAAYEPGAASPHLFNRCPSLRSRLGGQHHVG